MVDFIWSYPCANISLSNKYLRIRSYVIKNITLLTSYITPTCLNLSKCVSMLEEAGHYILGCKIIYPTLNSLFGHDNRRYSLLWFASKTEWGKSREQTQSAMARCGPSTRKSGTRVDAGKCLAGGGVGGEGVQLPRAAESKRRQSKCSMNMVNEKVDLTRSTISNYWAQKEFSKNNCYILKSS